MIRLKPDADDLRRFLEDLAAEDWVFRSERRVWPRFVFHCTDISNTVQVLKEGYLRSRQRLEQMGGQIIDSGSSSVLAGTDAEYKDCVRLYFRTKTPTQYHAEGIRSKTVLSSSRFPDAHCPVPVFLLFDSAAILSRQDCRFSDGNLGSPRSQTYSTASELKQLPWKHIYHNDALIDPGTKQEIIRRRCAEVIVPQKLDLTALRFLYCRSDAEKETFLHLLPENLAKKYQGKILATARSEHFFRRHTFIQRARLSSTSVVFQLSPETQSPGPFHCQATFEFESLQRTVVRKDFRAGSRDLQIEWNRPITDYQIRLTLDGHLAYANRYRETVIPF